MPTLRKTKTSNNLSLYFEELGKRTKPKVSGTKAIMIEVN